MASKLFFTTTLIIALCISGTTKAQQCGGPVPVLTVYTTIDRQASLSFGSEFGVMRDESPWGYYGGIVFTIKKPGTADPQKETLNGQTVYPTDLTIYMKGSYRLLQTDLTSIHAVTSVEMDTKSKLDSKTGLRFLVPVSDRVALSAEPVYSLKDKTVTARVGLSIAF